MKANELRIGNWVLTNNGVKPITTLETHDCSTLVSGCERAIVWRRYSEIKAVELTKEWLLNLCLELTRDYYYLPKYKFGVYIDYSGEAKDFQVFFGEDEPCYYSRLISVKYVHQLQNLYFALTGEELEVKNGN